MLAVFLEARGELAPGVDAMLLFGVLGATLHERLFLHPESVDERFLGSLLDLLLFGAGSKRRPG